MSRRNSITIATAGHVDHGKTALVRQITGVNTDTLAEEKARGLSINLGYAYYHFESDHFQSDHLQTDPEVAEEKYTIGFIDVPGHRDFINNALAGISVVDSALLVIAADDGVMPQTREHLMILNLLGIEEGVIAITKVDKCDSARLEFVRQEITDLLQGSTLQSAPVFEVSSITGEGIDDLIHYLQNTFIAIDQTITEPQQNTRFVIDRNFTVKGIGTVVTGTVQSGSIVTDKVLTHTGSKEEARIKSLRHDQSLISTAYAGERVALNINIALQKIKRGDWLVDSVLHYPVTRMDVKLQLLKQTDFQPSVKYHLYHGASHRLVSIRQLSAESPDYYQIACAEPLFALHGDRFILRDPAASTTVGGGQVIDIFVPRRGRTSEERIEVVKMLDQEPIEAMQALLNTQDAGIDLENFSLARNLNTKKTDQVLKQLCDNSIEFVQLSSKENSHHTLLHRKFFDQFVEAIESCLGSYHQSHSNQLGMSEPALSKSVAFKNSHLLFHAILEQLVATGLIRKTGTLLHLPDHKVQLSDEEQNFMIKIRPVLQKSGFLPPRTRELTDITGMELRTLEKTLAQARKAGSLIQVAPNRHYLPETMMQLAEFTESLAQHKEEGFSVIQFRDEIGIGRNLCIELLEYFDKIGFTRRDGNSRFLRTSKENLFEQSS